MWVRATMVHVQRTTGAADIRWNGHRNTVKQSTTLNSCEELKTSATSRLDIGSAMQRKHVRLACEMP